MEKLLKNPLSILIILLIYLTGCKDVQSLEEGRYPSLTPRYLSIIPNSFSVYNGNSATEDFYVETLSSSWKFENYPSWVTIDPTSGDSSENGTLEISENDTSEPRSTYFYLRSNAEDWNYEQSVYVSQQGNTPYVNLEETSLEFSGSYETQIIVVKSNCEWEASTNQNWVTLQKGENGNSLSISVEENPSSSYRNAIVYLSYENKTYANIHLTQFPSEITVSDLSLDFENTASRYSISIVSESKWEAIVSDSWIQVDPSEGGAGELQVNIEVSQNGSVNERIGYVTILTGNESRLQIKIIQKGLYLETDSVLSFSSRASSETITIKSNISWELKSKPEWITVNPASGTGNTQVTIAVEENPLVNSRNGEIVWTSPGLDISYITSVMQSGQTLTPGSSVLEFSDKGGTQTLEITADGEWTSNVSQDWISVSPQSGKGDTAVTVSVEENPTEQDRTGEITYYFGEKEIKVIVSQQSKYFEIAGDSFTFDSKGGSHSLDLGTNQQWSATIEGQGVSSWLSLSKYSGEGEDTINIVVAPNPSLKSREAVIIFTPKFSQGLKINVHQAGMYLRVSTTRISFFSKGGESTPVYVETDGNYSLSTETPWISLKENENNSFLVIAEENESSDSREGSVVVTLQGLSEGSYSISIPVTQVGYGGSFIIEGYPGDQNWNDVKNGDLSIKIIGYTTDKNWNNDSHNSLNISIEGFGNEENWTTKSEGSLNLNVVDYSSEQNWTNK
ncbi:MAG: BACON domain-containing protein [Muribaculaceae bacterium]|nr:BACON domain-containing protein [Muribaculaceae bacterium]